MAYLVTGSKKFIGTEAERLAFDTSSFKNGTEYTWVEVDGAGAVVNIYLWDGTRWNLV